MKEVAVVFPNRRAGALFRAELIARIESPSWAPGIFSIDDWLTQLSGLEKTERLEELALLYPVVKKHVPHIEDFADFIDLGETLLGDFEDTDKYLADPRKLFTTLSETKKIDSRFDIASDEQLVERIRQFWTSFGEGRSRHQEKWLEIWEKLLPIYLDFNELLLNQGLGTSGMCYRKAAEGVIGGTVSLGRYKQVVFAGFNILTGSEEAVFSSLRDRGSASFYWDYHPHYLREPHKAGKFMSQYLLAFPPPEGFNPFPEGARDFFEPVDHPGRITVVPVTSNTGQVQALIQDILGRPDARRGIILSDEGLFSDFLTSWPEDRLPVNFTSGYPLGDTQAAGLFRVLLDIFLNFSQSPEGKSCTSALILEFLQHPWAQWLTGNPNDKLVRTVQRRFPESVPMEFIDEDSRLSPWMGHSDTSIDFIGRLSAAANRLLEFESGYYRIEKAAIGSMIEQMNLIERIIGKHNLVPDARSLVKLFSRFLNTNKITLETDRSAINQVTGILETRLLDFDEVFILSFNEGIWPSKSLPGSLIPYSIRKMFSLPTSENRDAMYAYYFYRLIQRAGTIHIYYLTGHRDDRIRSGEKSRYITQLQFEFPGRIEYRSEPAVRVGRPARSIEIRKEGIVLERLNRFLSGSPDGKWLSPSAVNEYLDCSLRFALKRIYDIREPDEIAFASEPKGFGILIHQVMHRLYEGFIGAESAPDSRWYKEVLTGSDYLPGVIREEYGRLLEENGASKPGGKDLLAMEVVRQFLSRILEFDQKNRPMGIIGLERKYQLEFPIGIRDENRKVRLNGIIDRIDRVQEGVRIVDYKTGKAELNVRSLADLFNPENAKRPKEAFQVLMYCEMVSREDGNGEILIPCLFRLGRFRAGDYEHRLQVGGEEFVYSEIRDDFISGLKLVLERLFDPEIPFIQAEDEQVCRYCPFTGLCCRESYS